MEDKGVLTPGLRCPKCHGSTTSYSISQGNEGWFCQECNYWFSREDAYKPSNAPPKLFAITEDGGHWYRRQEDGYLFLITKEEMKLTEDRYIRPEHSWSCYDPIEDYQSKKFQLQLEDEIKIKEWMKTLTPEQKESLY